MYSQPIVSKASLKRQKYKNPNKHKGKERKRKQQLMGLPINPGSQKTDGGAGLTWDTG